MGSEPLAALQSMLANAIVFGLNPKGVGMRIINQYFILLVLTAVLAACGEDSDTNPDTTDSVTEIRGDEPADEESDDTTNTDNPEPDPSAPLEIAPTDAEQVYMDYWMDQDQDFVASLKWLPHYIYEQGELGICLKLDFQSPQTVTGDQVEAIRAKIEERVWQWQRGLIGQPHWTHDTRTPVQLFGIGATEMVQLEGAPDIPVYVNEGADCPGDCFRFTYKHDANPLYADCTHSTMSHFDFNIWYSDYGFGAAGHGGDWGTRLDWELFLNELVSDLPTVTDHELGHVAGLPDVYNYPMTLDSQPRPPAIMATDPGFQNFDYLMLRKVWELGWAAFYADEAAR